jgi:hypothetical protein
MLKKLYCILIMPINRITEELHNLVSVRAWICAELLQIPWLHKTKCVCVCVCVCVCMYVCMYVCIYIYIIATCMTDLSYYNSFISKYLFILFWLHLVTTFPNFTKPYT